jgi:ectoine hydroxylase-related dioxygenase (phytanoyl-CoA dioxygenase family)
MDALMNQEASDSFLRPFNQDGIFVFRNLINADDIAALKVEVNKIHELVLQKIVNLPRPLSKHTDFAERKLGRLDYRCGFTADIFAEVAKPVTKLVQTISPTIDFKHYWGAIPTEAGAAAIDMHRDVYPLQNTTTGVNLGELDLLLPPYYFTVLIPLMEITQENGPTQFVKNSRRQMCVTVDEAEIYSPLLSPGDVVIFDGRTLHKGSPNNSKEQRMIAYITYVAEWYHDQTFVVNKYLFPELA